MPLPGESAGVGESTPTKRTNPYVTPQQQRSAEQEAQKHLGETVTIPKPRPYVLDATIPVASTGEPYNEWLGRRFDLAFGSLPNYGPGFALQVAASPISDPELKHLSRMANIAGTHEFITSFITGPARQDMVSEIKARLDQLTDQDAFLIHQETGIDPKLVDVARLKDVDPSVAKDILEALKTRDPKPFWQRNLLDPLGQGASNVSQFFLGEQGRLPGTQADPGNLLRQGILEESYHQVAPKVATAGIATLAGAAQISGAIGDVVDSVTPGRLPEFLHRPKPPDIGKVYSDAVEMGPGRAVSFYAGIDPDSGFGHILSGTYDFASRIFVDPLGPALAVSRGYKLAKVLPKGGGAVPLRGLARATYLDLALSPEELIQTSRWSKVRRGIWRDVQKAKQTGNVYGLVDSWALPPGLGDELLAVAGPDELDDVIVNSMRGIQSGVTRQAYEARLVKAKEALTKAKAEVEDVHIGGPVTGKSAKDLPELESTVRGAEQTISSIEKILASGKAAPGTIIRELPSTGIMKTIRNTIKRPSQDKPFGEVVSFFSDDEWARKALPAHGRVPHKPISLDPADLQDAARDFSDVGKLYGLSRNQIDDFTSRFIRATTDSEARDAYVDMLKAAKGNLPKGIGEELTQYIDNISGNGYWIDADGRTLQGWDKVVTRLGSEQRYFMPIFDSQLARALPLPDLRKVIESRSYIGRFEDTLKGIRGNAASQFLARTPVADKVGQKLGGAIQLTRELMGGFTSTFWIPSVLIRLGWTARVIIDEQLRLIASGVNPLEENLLSLLGKSTLDEIPEKALGTYSRIPIRSRPISGFAPLRKGEKGYASALQEDLVFLHNDHLARYIATHTDDEVKAFLKTPEGSYFADRWSHVLQAGGKTTDEWIAAQRQAIEATVGKSPELREAVRRGYVNLNRSVKTTVRGKLREVSRVRIDSENGQLAIRQLLESAPETLPNAARGTGEFFIRTDPSVWRRGTAQVMELLGTKPTRALSRRPAYKFWYRNELQRLKNLGVDDALASQTARQYAIKQVGQILYDSAERTAGELMVHNLSPFLPAWKEVFTRWLYTIPAQSGLGIGHANIVRRLQVLFNALKDEGLLVQNLEGDWELRASGIDKALRWYYNLDPTKFTRPDGSKGELRFHAGIPIRNANILGNWPGFGPLPTLGFKQIVEGSERWDAVLRNFYPYGVDGSLGPRTWSRILRGVGLDPPWDMFDAKYQQTLYDFSVIDVMRARKPEIDQIRAMPSNTPEEQDRKLKAFRDFVDSAQAQAGSVMVRRGFLGLLLPVQPRNYWPGQEEVEAFRKSLEEMDPTTKKTAYAEFLDDHPELALSFVAKTERIRGEVERESFEDRSRNELRRELLSGNIKAIPPERWVEVAIGDVNYQTIRRKEREELADLGSNGADWLFNGAEYVRIRNEADAAIERLKVEDQQLFHGSWQQYYKASLDRSAERKGLPRPTLEETYARGLARTLGVIRSIIPLDPLDEASRDGQAAISRFRRELYKAANLDAYYRDDEMPPGPERDIARYYNQVDEYWKQVEDIAKNYTSDGHSAAKIAEGHLLRQRLRNDYGTEIATWTAPKVLRVYAGEGDLPALLQVAVSRWNRDVGGTVLEITKNPAKADVSVVLDTFKSDAYQGEYRPAQGDFAPVVALQRPERLREDLRDELPRQETLIHELGHALGLDHPADHSKELDRSIMGTGFKITKQNRSDVRKLLKMSQSITRAVVLDGVTYPHPEEAAFLSQTPEEQRRRKMAWVYSPMAWLAPYQRKALGLDEKRTKKAVEFWDGVSEARMKTTQFIQSKGWPPGKLEAKNLRAYLQTYEAQLADYYGVTDEYRFAKLPNYKRMAHFKDLTTSDSWKRVRQGADAAWDALKLSEVSPRSTYGRQIQISFASWINGLREDDDRLNADLTVLQAAAPSFVGGSLDDPDRGFYAWLFFTEGK